MNKKAQSIKQSADQFLLQVGDKVRSLRARRGMTRKNLAHDSGVSERYLANLEQGNGNISISLLRQIAGALNTEVSDLVSSNAQRSPELSLITQFVSELPPMEQQAALQLLYEKFTVRSGAQKRVVLIGLRGAGKTTLGKLLEQRSNHPFIKLVDEVEKLAGMSISEIFSLSGQSGYQRLEERALINTLDEYQSCCIETGGSIVSEPKALNILLTSCFVVWVKATPEEHMQRVINQGDMRPMANNKEAMADLRQILSERRPFYKKASAVLDTSGKSVEESYLELEQMIQKNTQFFGANLTANS